MPTTPPNAKPQVTFGADFGRYDSDAYDFLRLHMWNATVRLPLGTLKPLGKAPLAPKWTTIRVVSRDVRRRCLAEGRNMGIRLKPTDLVLDIDPRNGGDEGFETLCFDIGLNEEQWPCVVTGSGGRHYYLRLPEGVSVVEMLDGYPGVEFKSVGRQVVAAGSRHPNGKLYRWSRSHPDIRKGVPMVPTPLLNVIRRVYRGHSTGAGGVYTPEQLDAMLARLDVLDFQDEHEWRQLMFACHHATDGDGEAEFVAWSGGDPNFAGDSAIVIRRWRSCRDKPNAITCGTLHYILRQHDAGDAIPAAPTLADDGFPDDLGTCTILGDDDDGFRVTGDDAFDMTFTEDDADFVVGDDGE